MTHDLLDPGGSLGCPAVDIEALHDLLDGLLPEGSSERTRLVDHVCACRACQLELRTAPAVGEAGAGLASASTDELLAAVRAAARARVLELARELFQAELRRLDEGEELVLHETVPRPASELRIEHARLAARLERADRAADSRSSEGAGAPLERPAPPSTTAGRTAGSAADTNATSTATAADVSAAVLPDVSNGAPAHVPADSTAAANPPRAQALVAQLEALGDEGWARHGAEVLRARRLPTVAAQPTEPAASGLGRAQHLLAGRAALARGDVAGALALAEGLLAERADDLAAVALRLAARAAGGDLPAVRRAARRFAQLEGRHPQRAWRRWARGRVAPWARRLGVEARLLASWLGLPAPARRAPVTSPFPVVMPDPRDRPWRPLRLDEPFDVEAPLG